MRSQDSSPPTLVTVRKDDEFPIGGLVARWDDKADIDQYGIGVLVHGLLDFVIDNHFEAVESLDDQIEQLEVVLFDDLPHDREVQVAASSCARVYPSFRAS